MDAWWIYLVLVVVGGDAGGGLRILNRNECIVSLLDLLRFWDKAADEKEDTHI